MKVEDITSETLKKWSKSMIQKWWDIDEQPEIMVSNKKWKRRYACYWSGKKTIEFTRNSIENQLKDGGVALVKDTLLHELCHWYLDIKGLPYDDADHRFAEELIRVGASPTGAKSGREAYDKARESLNKDVFIIESNNSYNDTLRDEISLIHPRKNKEDFKKDLMKTMIKLKNTDIEMMKNGDLDLDYTPYHCVQDIAEFMIKWHGYKHEETSVRGVVRLSSDGYGNVMCEDKNGNPYNDSPIEDSLESLGMSKEEIDKYMQNWMLELEEV